MTDWIILRDTTGTGNKSFPVSASDNTTGAMRKGKIVFTTSGGDVAEVGVVQYQKPYITQQPPYNLSAEGGKTYFTIRSYAPWWFRSIYSWVTVTDEDGNVVTEGQQIAPCGYSTADCPSSVSEIAKTYTITAAANTSTVSRNDGISIGWQRFDGNSAYSGVVYVNQYGATKDVDIPTRSPSEGETPTSGNASWTATVDVDWILLKKTSGSKGESVTYDVSENNTGASRVGKITITYSDGTIEYIQITQSGSDANYSYKVLSVSPETATVKWYVDSSKAVEVTTLTNTKYSSLYAYCSADGYISQGTTVQGVANDTATVSFTLKEEPVVEDYININPATIEISGEGGTATVEVDSNICWKVEEYTEPVVYTYSYKVLSVSPETATVKWYVDSSKAVEVTTLTNTEYTSLYAYCEADGYISQGTTVQGVPNGTATVSFTLEKNKYSYAANVSPSTATVKWYVDETMAVEVTNLTNTEYTSLYAYCTADGYTSQGQTVQGVPNGTATVSFTLMSNTKITYTSTDGNAVTPTTLSATDAAGNGLSYTNTYTNGQGVIEFNGVAAQVDMSFWDCTTLKTFDGFSNRVRIKSGYCMFYGCSELTSLNVSNFDTSSVTNMCGMFYNCSNLTSLDVSGFNTSQVTDMYCMFYNCSNLTSLDVSGFNTSQVTDMNGMFSSCKSLTSLDVSGFNTSQVTDMYGMFSSCKSLTSLDVSGFNTSKVTDMGYMFYNCKSLTSLDVSNFNTSKVTKMNLMFYDCPSLTSLDLSGFDTSSVTKMFAMFYGCSSLSSLNVSNFDTSQVVNMYEMFYNCSKLTSLDLSSFNTSKVTDMNRMFYYCSELTSLNVSNFNTLSVTKMHFMFCDCSSLTSLDLSGFNTSQVTDMNSMFYGCEKLASLDVSKFNTSEVTDMSYMFYNCKSLTSLDLSSFNTIKVTSMESMFLNCSKLISLNISNFDTSSVINMRSMFDSCGKLTSLDVSKFNTSKVAYMEGLFNNCSSLTSLNVSGFNTSKVTSMEGLFNNCPSLTSLDVSNFDTSQVTDMGSMFAYCSLLTSIDVSGFNTSKVIDMTAMFNNCSKLTSLDLSGFNTSQVTDMNYMFCGCEYLTSLDLSGFDTSSVTNMNNMFNGSFALGTLKIGSNCSIGSSTTTTGMLGNLFTSGTLYYPSGMAESAYNKWLPTGWTAQAY